MEDRQGRVGVGGAQVAAGRAGGDEDEVGLRVRELALEVVGVGPPVGDEVDREAGDPVGAEERLVGHPGSDHRHLEAVSARLGEVLERRRGVDPAADDRQSQPPLLGCGPGPGPLDQLRVFGVLRVRLRPARQGREPGWSGHRQPQEAGDRAIADDGVPIVGEGLEAGRIDAR